MFADFLGCHQWDGAPGLCCAEARDAANRRALHGQTLEQESIWLQVPVVPKK